MSIKRVASLSVSHARKELRRQEKEAQRDLNFKQSNQIVDEHEHYIFELSTIHKSHNTSIDWESIADEPIPEEPVYSTMTEDKARDAFINYYPGIFDRILKREEKKREKLKAAIPKAKNIDEEAHQKNLQKWQQLLETYEQKTGLAKQVLSSDHSAMLEVIKDHNPFKSISHLDTEVAVSVKYDFTLEATFSVQASRLVPKETFRVLKSGKLSVKQMPKGKYFEISKNYVCGCVLRVANELFALLPVKCVVVTATDRMLNEGTCVIENQPIVWVVFYRNKLEKLFSHSIDPFDCITQFRHRMKFYKTKGFQAIDEIPPLKHFYDE